MNPDERRKHHRGGFAGKAEYRGSRGVSGALITDISAGGARLITDAPEKPGEHVALRLTPEGQNGQSLDLEAQVIWARQVPPFWVGIRFVGLSEAQQRKLTALIG